jgi:hypothetical protein
MRSAIQSPTSRGLSSRVSLFGRVLVLLVPAGLLLLASLRISDPKTQHLLWIGAGVQGVFFLGVLLTGWLFRRLNCTAIIFIYALALAWLWLTQSMTDDWFSPLAQFLLLAIPLGVFAVQSLDNSGAVAARRANILAQRLANRKEWPEALSECANLPEVKAFREALAINAMPAVNLLQDPRPEVQMAALAALEYRQDWRTGQAETVLKFAKRTDESALRAAAVLALGNLEDRSLVEMVAEFLRDSSGRVRQATIEVLFWDCETRWAWIRHAVHQALGDPARAGDGPITWEGPPLPPEALNDLLAWCAEKGPIAHRAAQTLTTYYHRMLNTSADPGLIRTLQQQVGNMQAPPTLRIEMAQVLRGLGELDRELQEQLIGPSNPAPLRLLAAECLLVQEHFPPAVVALREIARMPNREMSLETANVVQRRLGVDLGLALGQPLPPVQSKAAADVMRRLMQWAANPDDPDAAGSDPKLQRPVGKRDSGYIKFPPGTR